MVHIIKTARLLRGAASILGVAFLLTCSDDSGTGPENKNDEPTPITISLSTTSAVPLDEIDITGVPSNLDIGPVYATVEAVGSDAVSDAFVNRRQDGTVYMLAPLKPAEFDIANGGDVDITLEGGGIMSNTVRLTIEPLPPATTTVQEACRARHNAARTPRYEDRGLADTVFPVVGGAPRSRQSRQSQFGAGVA
jgi:hypothetical protein